MKVINNNPKEVNKDWRTFTKDIQWETYFKEMIPKSNLLLKKSLMIIYHNQTQDEQCTEQVTHRNGMGFTMADAKSLTMIAKKFEQDLFVTQEELNKVRIKLPKYWKQLMNEAKSKNTEIK